MEETSNISIRRTEVTTAIDRAKLCHDLVNGTPAMQKGGWILKGSAENQKDYDNRVNQAYLYNGYKRTRGYLAGQVFDRDMVMSDDSQYKELFDRMVNNVDLQGNNLRTFAKEFFLRGIDEGCRFLIAQYPYVQTDTNGNYYDNGSGEWRQRTRQSDIENGWRPYFVQFGYDNLLGWRYEYQNGVKVLTQLRIMEDVISELGETDIGDKKTQQVRLLEPGYWATYRKVSENANEQTWDLYEEGTTSIDLIPLSVWMPGEYVSDMTAIPALEDLAYLNVRHFIATADQNVLYAYVRRPPWFGRQLVNDGETVQFGPGRLVHSTSENANLQSVGIDAGSVEAGRSELSDLETRMSLYGLMILTQRNTAQNKTATESNQNISESTSQLKEWALSLEHTFENAFIHAAKYEDPNWEVNPSDPMLSVNTEFQPAMGLDPAVLIQAVGEGLLSKEQVFGELKRRGLVSDAYDWQDVMAMIKNEGSMTVGPTGQGLSGLAGRILGR